MATLLTLVQDVERESGTMSGVTLSTVSGATGRHVNFIKWVIQAWSEMQTERSDWRWMRADFEASITAGLDSFDAGALGITRFSSWVHDTDDQCDFTLWVTADGQENEGYLRFIPWSEFRRVYTVGSAATTTGTPTVISVDPSNNLRLWPIPDADCTLRGEYMKSPQTLADDADTPELPAQYHHAIRLRALLKCVTFDEAPTQYPLWQRELATVWTSMLRTQTPRFKTSEPLA